MVVTQHRTDKTGGAEMYPVRALVALVIRIQSYASVRTQGTTNVGINALASRNGKLEGILSKEVLKQLRDVAAAGRERKLGSPVDSIGMHLIRAGAAMAMFLARVPCATIQLIGSRWRSRMFMKYLRIQVTASTRGVTTKMTSLDSFFTVTISDDSDENDEETRLQKWPKPSRHARPRTNKPGARSAKQQGKA